MFNSIKEIKAANDSAGEYFFSADTMRFFDSRTHSGLYVRKDEEQGEDVTYFITSERYSYGEPRMYTVRYALDNGKVGTASEFQEFRAIEDARVFAKASAGMDLKKYRWIVYVHAFAGSELHRVASLEEAKDRAWAFRSMPWVGDDVTAALYPYSAEDWAGAKKYEDIGCPFDYPTKVIEFGPRGGAKVSNA